VWQVGDQLPLLVDAAEIVDAIEAGHLWTNDGAPGSGLWESKVAEATRTGIG
jgi:hypothetical protein